MPDKRCGGCLDFDRLHECCRVRVDDGVPSTYLAVTATTPACPDYNTAQSLQLPWFTRFDDRQTRQHR
ncbi:MAG: hypothetical protein WCD18_14270 [Thermosynechococcaceae cyanobacterium]